MSLYVGECVRIIKYDGAPDTGVGFVGLTGVVIYDHNDGKKYPLEVEIRLDKQTTTLWAFNYDEVLVLDL